MNYAAILWLGLMIGFIMLESSTVCLISIWFAVGSLAALIVSFFWPFWAQILVFFAVAVLLLASLRPLTRKYLTPKLVKTNVDSVIGSEGLVTEAIDNVQARGQVKLGAMEWSARSTSGENLSVGTRIRVDRIEGVKVFVSPAAEAVQTK